MKQMKKYVSLLLALVMVLAMTLTVSAAGTNTISVTGAQNGEKYNIYKMLDLSVDAPSTPTAYRYTINANWHDFWIAGSGAAYIDAHTSGLETYVTWKTGMDTAEKMQEFGKAAAQWAKDNSITADGLEQTAAVGEAKWTGLDNGYYLVTSTYGIAASVASTPANPTQVIEEKNNENTVEKKVREDAERNGTAQSYGDSNDTAIGQTVNFRTKVTIAKNSVKVVYHDTMDSALNWTGESNVIVSKIDDMSNPLETTKYSVNVGASPETFTVSFTDDYVASLTTATTDLWIFYTAVLTEDAYDLTSVTNTGYVAWGENSKSADSITTTSTHSFQILKYDALDTYKNPLAGAKFKLYTAQTSPDPLTLAVSGDGKTYLVVDTTTDAGTSLPTGYTLTADNKIVTLDTDKITVIGVDSDDYWLEETDAPVGFTALTGRTKVQVGASNDLIAEIENKQGTTLPSTGGIGTTIFYVLGAVLVLGAAVLLITKRRMNAEK